MKSIKKMTLALSAVLMVSCGNQDREFDASGVFETTEVIVSAKGNGELLAFNVEEGQEVVPEVLLGCVDTTQLSLRRKQLVATLNATDSRKLDEQRQLAILRQQIAIQKREKARFEELLKDNAATQKQVDDINNQLEVLERQLSATSEQISSSNSSVTGQSAGILAQIAQIDKSIEDCKIISPIAGIVLSKYAEKGEFATPGRALFKVGNIKDMKLRAYITADQITTLKIGQKVKVYADLGETGRKEFDGTVMWISSEAEFTPKTIQTRSERSNLVYAIKIAVSNDGTIKRGMYGDVKF